MIIIRMSMNRMFVMSIAALLATVALLLVVSAGSAAVADIASNAPPRTSLSTELPANSQRIYAHTLATQHAHLLSRLRSFAYTRPEPLSLHPHTMSTSNVADSSSSTLYPNSYSFKMNALGKVFEVNMKKNEDLLSKDYQHIRLDFGGVTMSEEHSIGFKQPVTTRVRHSLPPSQNCYYHGHVTGDPNSIVALSTCHGVSGHIIAHGEALGITPDPFDGSVNQSKVNSALRHLHRLSATNDEQREKITHSHIVYRLQDYAPVKTICGFTQPESQQASTGKEETAAESAVTNAKSDPIATTEKTSTTTPLSKPLSFASRNQPESTSASAPEPLQPGSIIPKMRFVELLVVNDWSRYQRLGEATEADTLSLVNLISSYYKSTHFKYEYRIVLVGQVSFQNGDPYMIPYVTGTRPNRPATPTKPVPSTPTTPSHPPSTPTTPPPPSSKSPEDNQQQNSNQNQPDFSNLPQDMQHLIPEILNNMQKNPPTNTNPYVQPYNPYYPFPQVNPFGTSDSHDTSTLSDLQSPSTQSQGYGSSQASSSSVETQGGNGLLEVFNDWQSQQTNLPKRDTTQLFSSLSFASGILGLANVGMTCQDRYSGSVCEINEPSAVQNAVIAAHETGHTLGMSHDSMGNNCPQSGYIMAAVAGTGHTFSSCSIDYCNQWTDSNEPSSTCVENVPSVWENANSEIANKTDTTKPQVQINASESHDTVSTAVQSVVTGPIPLTPVSHMDRHFDEMIQKADSATASTTVTTSAPSSPTSAPSHEVPYMSYMLVAACCFAMGVLVTYAVEHLRSQSVSKPLLAPAHQLRVTSTSSPTAASLKQPSFSLHIAPSQPSTPIAASSVESHPAPTPSPSPSPSPIPPQDHHFTRAKRRVSLSQGRASDTARNETNVSYETENDQHPAAAQ